VRAIHSKRFRREKSMSWRLATTSPCPPDASLRGTSNAILPESACFQCRAAASEARRWRSLPRAPICINPLLFSVQLTDVVDVLENKVGIVTTREGAALATGPVVEGHNMFQNPQAFIDQQGSKGLQEFWRTVNSYGRYWTAELIGYAP
jgi:hypothetical protein